MASGGKAALRTARQVLKFISEGRNFDSIIKNVFLKSDFSPEGWSILIIYGNHSITQTHTNHISRIYIYPGLIAVVLCPIRPCIVEILILTDVSSAADV